MNKLIIGLLIVAAAGAGIFFYLRKEKEDHPTTPTNKELIVGKWAIDSLDFSKDTTSAAILLLALAFNNEKKIYDFNASGQINIFTHPDSLTFRDSAFFSWKADNRLTWKTNPADTITETFSVIKLNKEQLVLETTDSVTVYFKKV